MHPDYFKPEVFSNRTPVTLTEDWKDVYEFAPQKGACRIICLDVVHLPESTGEITGFRLQVKPTPTGEYHTLLEGKDWSKVSPVLRHTTGSPVGLAPGARGYYIVDAGAFTRMRLQGMASPEAIINVYGATNR